MHGHDDAQKVFAADGAQHECYSADGINAGCAGEQWCSLWVSGPFGAKLTWKSTCGGYAYTVLDGKDEKALFSCGNSP